MSALLATVVVCITVVYVIERLVRLAERLPRFQHSEPAKAAPPMPSDLYALATNTYSGNSDMDRLLHEQQLAAMREAYQDVGSWDLVRQRFAQGQ